MPWLFRIAGTAWCESKWIVLNMIIPLGDFARLAYVSCQVSGDRATGLWRCGVATALLASVHSLRVTLWAQGRACLWAACGAVVVAFLALFHGGLLQPSMILKGTAAGLYLSHASGSRRWALVLLTVLWVPLCVWYRVRQRTCDRSCCTAGCIDIKVLKHYWGVVLILTRDLVLVHIMVANMAKNQNRLG